MARCLAAQAIGCGVMAALVCSVLVGPGCGRSQSPGNGTAPSQAFKAPVEWQPQPIELPKSTRIERTDQDDFRAAERARWPGSGSCVASICFDLQGDSALVALASGECHLLDAKTAESRVHWDTVSKARIVAMEITLDAKHAVMQHDDDTHLYVYSLSDGKVEQTIDHGNAKISAFAVATDPRLLAVGDDAGAIRIWNVETGKMLADDKVQHAGGRATAIAFANDCAEVYVGDNKSTDVDVYELPDLVYTKKIEHYCGRPLKLVSDWSGNFLSVVCHDKSVELITLRQADGSTSPPYHSMGGAMLRCGKFENYFCLQSNTTLCCYLGETAFEYRGLPSGGFCGSQSIDATPIAEVALTRDGTLGATGFADGSVRLYDLPGPGKTLLVRHRELGLQLHSLLDSQKYDELDKLANDLLGQTKADADRAFPPVILAEWLAIKQKTDAEWKSRLDLIQKWLDAKPESRAARYVLGHALREYAWFVRGADVAVRTSPEAMRGHYEQLVKADKLLEEADEIGPCAPICAERIVAAMGTGKSTQTIIELWERGVEQDPQYADLHSGAGYALLPRWSGNVGDVARLADHARDKLPGDAGQLAYARIAEMFMSNETPAGILAAGFDLDKLEEAAQATLRVYPESQQGQNFAAIVACMRQDHAAATDRFAALAGHFNMSTWKHESVLNQFRAWARHKPVPSDSEISFLGSWLFMRQIAFTGEENELVTLGSDYHAPIQIWDAANAEVDRVLPLPEFCGPWFMSVSGRFVVCVRQKAPQPQIVVFDIKTGQSLTWAGAVAGRSVCLSDDERQLGMYAGDKRLTFYDLQEPAEGPAHIVPIKTDIAAMELPIYQKTWSVAVCEPGGRLRHLSQEGKDLLTPVQLPRAAVHMQMLADSPRVLVKGESLLAIVDLESGKMVELVGEMPPQSDHYRYTALGVSRDGKLAAVARRHLQPATVERPYEIEIWNLTSHRRLRVFAGHQAQIFTLSFSANNHRLASGDRLGFVHVWNLKSLEQ